jgi:hypothetical protein
MVRDPGGNPAPNVPVEFVPEDGECDPPRANTGPDGKAETRYIPGPGRRTQKIKVISPMTANFVKFIEFIRFFSPEVGEAQ